MLQTQTRNTYATTHYIFYIQKALFILTVLTIPTQTKIMRTKFSSKQIFCQEKLQKNTWLDCQGYYYADQPAKIDGNDSRADSVAARIALVANSQENYFVGKPANDILTCAKNSLTGFTQQI